ncbi:MAG: 8-amino-7-oxononanoate synthase [Frankiales bacterium]|nr:8-amino-7-oxononanoate synthase [Frankiales bacterium]
MTAAGGVFDWLTEAADQRAKDGMSRALRPRPMPSRRLTGAVGSDNGAVGAVDLASNDYLDLSRDPRVTAAAGRAAAEWGAGSTGSRLVTGSTELHQELERHLAEFVSPSGSPRAALVFSSGYLANLAAVTALSGPDCLVVSDAANHASLVDGCRLARSDVVVTARRDLAAAELALTSRTTPRALVVVDAVDSADGTLFPLAEWHAVCRRHGAVLLVDDAHGLGVRGGGRGSVYESGLSAAPDVVVTVTLSKALGSQGGAIVAIPAVIGHLINTARSFIFDTGLNPPAAAAALTAIQIIAAEPELAALVLDRASVLAPAAGVAATDSAVVPIIIGEAARAFDLAARLFDDGFVVGCFRPPSVPVGTARLRLTARAGLSDDDIARFAATLGAAHHALAGPPPHQPPTTQPSASQPPTTQLAPTQPAPTQPAPTQPARSR